MVALSNDCPGHLQLQALPLHRPPNALSLSSDLRTSPSCSRTLLPQVAFQLQPTSLVPCHPRTLSNTLPLSQPFTPPLSGSRALPSSICDTSSHTPITSPHPASYPPTRQPTELHFPVPVPSQPFVSSTHSFIPCRLRPRQSRLPTLPSAYLITRSHQDPHSVNLILQLSYFAILRHLILASSAKHPAQPCHPTPSFYLHHFHPSTLVSIRLRCTRITSPRRGCAD